MAADGDMELTGVWDGEFAYPGLWKPTAFTAVLLDFSGALSGTVHERPTDGPSAGLTLDAYLEGDRSGAVVRFIKSYEATDRPRRPVHYEGRLSGDGAQIEGRWSIPGNWSGRFVMVRSRPASVAEEVAERVAEPVD